MNKTIGATQQYSEVVAYTFSSIHCGAKQLCEIQNYIYMCTLSDVLLCNAFGYELSL